jgi:FkbM family methyltransferase
MSHLRTAVRRARSVIALAREQGPGAVIRRVVARLRGADRPDESGLVFQLLRGTRRGVMVDVGAHSGTTLSAFADAGWQVYAFEPDAQNRRPLEARYGAQGNVVIDPRAVSDKPAESVTLFRSDVSSGISGLSRFHASHVASGTVDVTTLTAVCLDHHIEAIDFLKIDTEGYDLFVLRGVPWEALAPHVIVCEFEDAKTVPLGYTFHDLARYLQQHGYRVVVSEWYPVKRYGGVHDWRRFARYPCELIDRNGWGNLIATRSETTYATLIELCERWRER